MASVIYRQYCGGCGYPIACCQVCASGLGCRRHPIPQSDLTTRRYVSCQNCAISVPRHHPPGQMEPVCPGNCPVNRDGAPRSLEDLLHVLDELRQTTARIERVISVVTRKVFFHFDRRHNFRETPLEGRSIVEGFLLKMRLSIEDLNERPHMRIVVAASALSDTLRLWPQSKLIVVSFYSGNGGIVDQWDIRSIGADIPEELRHEHLVFAPTRQDCSRFIPLEEVLGAYSGGISDPLTLSLEVRRSNVEQPPENELPE